MKLSFPQTNSVVDVGEGKEVNGDVGNRGAGPQLAIALVKYVEQVFPHVERRLAQDFLSNGGGVLGINT